ncbi:MAG: CHAT domain-containing tetratricopeptide repeat protein [Planctomycetota bacterium]|jgi:CHAT domain-containing protein/Tfp pilus assembly protein PilF
MLWIRRTGPFNGWVLRWGRLALFLLLLAGTARSQEDGKGGGEEEKRAVFITYVSPWGNAVKVGMKAGDILISVAGKPIEKMGDFDRARAEARALEKGEKGKVWPVVLARIQPDGKEVRHTVQIGMGTWGVNLGLSPPSAIPRFLKHGAPLLVKAEQAFLQGFLHYRQGNYKPCLKAWREGLALAEKAGEPFQIARHAGNVGTILQKLEQYAEALKQQERSLKISQEHEDPFGMINGLCNLGLVYLDICQYPKALALTEKALALAKQFGNEEQESTLLGNLGILYRHLGRYGDALDVQRKALARVRKAGSRKDVADTLSNMGNTLMEMDQVGKALALYEEALAIHKIEGNARGMAKALGNMGNAFGFTGKMRKAMDCQQTALEIFRKWGTPTELAGALLNVGGNHFDLGDYEKALASFREALKNLEGGKNPLLEARIRANMGYLYQHLGQFEVALEEHGKAKAIAERIGDATLGARIMSSIGEVQARKKDFAQALRTFEAAQKVLEDTGNVLDRIRSSIYLGYAHSGLGNFSKALASYEAAIQLMREYGRSALEPSINRAILFGITMEVQNRREWIGRFLALLDPVLSELEKQMPGFGIGRVVQRRIGFFEWSMDRAWGEETEGKKIALGEAWNGIPAGTRKDCQASKFLGRTGLEVGFFVGEAVRAREFLWEMQKRSVDVERGVDPELLRKREDAKGRLNYLRSRLLNQASKKIVYDVYGNRMESAALREEGQRIRAEMAETLATFERTQRSIALASPALGALQAATPVRLGRLRKTLAEDELFLEFFLTGQEGRKHRIPLGGNDEASSSLLSPIDLQPSGTAYLLAATTSRTRLYRVGKTMALGDRVELFRMTVEAQRWCSATGDFREQARSLYRELLQPALEDLGDERARIRHLVISPDGSLTRLPFEVLLVKDSEKKTSFSELPYLMRDFSVEYTPGATAWVNLREGKFRRGSPGEVLVALADPDYGEGIQEEVLRSVGALGEILCGIDAKDEEKRRARRARLAERLSPEVREALKQAVGARGGGVLGRLPHTCVEVEAVASLFQEDWTKDQAVTTLEGKEDGKGGSDRKIRARVYLQRGAREFVTRKAEVLREAGVLHLACHGIADDLTPAEASVILTTKDLPANEDGFLTAAEVMELRTNANLVVLSACETGLGRILRGEGVQGLTRAWQFAGARTVVVSLWKVDDEATARFMTEFYRQYKKKGLRVTEALAEARRRMTASSKFASPVYWAAFTAHGER